MGKFVFGFILGGAFVFTSLKYHVVRADDGVHFVPKVAAQFGDAYVDIRKFTVTDWHQHRSLALALVQAKKGDLMQNAAASGFRQSMESVWQSLTGTQEVN